MTDRLPPPSPEALDAETESTFTIKGPGAVNMEAVLHTVDTPADWRESTGHTNLYFDVEAGGRRPDQTGYRAVVLE